jgi:hypothetical protein
MCHLASMPGTYYHVLPGTADTIRFLNFISVEHAAFSLSSLNHKHNTQTQTQMKDYKKHRQPRNRDGILYGGLRNSL